MSHNLFGDRFYSLRQPAWHNLGKVFDTVVSAREALDAIGQYRVYTEKVVSESGFELPLRAILRDPTHDDPARRYFGYSGTEYRLVTPQDVVSIWDESVTEPVETLGVLGYGETIFLSAKLPTIDVQGDQVENYLLLVNPMTGYAAAQVRVTPVRVVCQNTLIVAKKMSTEVYKVTHNSAVMDNLRSWLVGIVDRASERAKALEETFKIFADSILESAHIENVMEYAYELPKRPAKNVPDKVYREREEWWQAEVDSQKRRRQAVLELFNGKLSGYDNPATHGTAWGLYNAVVEFEDYRPSNKTTSRASAALFGDRATVKERAFDRLSQICLN